MLPKLAAQVIKMLTVQTILTGDIQG